jgi:ligand-binding sensor domain-containing protein/signal transduction histidine kinase
MSGYFFRRPWRQRWVLLGLAGYALGVAPASLPAETRGEPGYALRRWSSEEGLTGSDIKALARTADGFLWVATDLGLLRFDGARFLPLKTEAFPLDSGEWVSALFTDRAASLWAGTSHGRLFRWQGGVMREVAGAKAAPGAPITSMAEDERGALWMAGAGAGLRCYYQGAWHSSDASDALALGAVTAVASDASGRVWAAAAGRVLLWSGGKWTVFPAPTSPAQRVRAVAVGREGSVWAATTPMSGSLGGRVFHLKDGRWSEPLTPYPWPQDSKSSVISDLLEDETGRLWAVTSGSGVYCRPAGGDWQLLTQEGPLANVPVTAFIRDLRGILWLGLQGGSLWQAHSCVVTALHPEASPRRHIIQTLAAGRDGSVWAGTYGGGILRYRDGQWTSYGREEGLGTLHVFSVLEDSRTNVWAGLRNGLYRLENGQFRRVPGVAAGAFLALFEDREGTLWVGSNNGLARFRNGEVKVFRSADGVPPHDISCLAQDREGRLWLAVRERGLFRQAGARFNLFATHGPLDKADIRALHFDTGGALWIATFGQGLFQLKDGLLRRWTVQDGLPSDHLLSLIEDGAGTFWLSTANGIFGCAPATLEEYVPGRSPPVTGRHLLVPEGLDSAVCSGWGQPVATRAPDGRLWFPNQSAVAVFDPAALAGPAPQWPVSVDEVRSDGVLQVPDSQGVIRLRSGLRRLEFHYTLPDLLAAGRLRFRYRLNGLDDSWTEAGQQRIAYYNHLPPGRYEFRVMAGGPEGDWQQSRSALVIDVMPRLWERASVRIAAAVCLLGALVLTVWAVARARLRRRLLLLEAQQAAEAERQRIARDLHDNLGAGLTEIALMSDLAQADAEQAGDTRKNLNEIFAASHALARSLDETVWAISRKNETVEQSVVFICKAAQDFLRLAGIPCRLEVPEVLPATYFSATVRHNLFLATREAVNNVVKHSQATEVSLRVQITGEQLTLAIQDNGKGFAAAPHSPAPASPGQPPARSGLGNMVKRLRDIGGEAECQSQPGRGTLIQLRVPLQPSAELSIASSGD